jgi:RNA-directed DNA polymerase
LISPNLANIALNGLGKAILGKFTQRERSAKKINVVRYADDFIVTGLSKEVLEREVKPTIVTFMKERGLSLSEEKTHITPIEKGFDFLGFNVRKYNGKLLIKPSKKSLKNVAQKIGKTFNTNKTARTCNLIRLLNPIIRGWANYYQGSVSKEAFAKIDHVLWSQSWKWAKRRHPKKSKPWITHRYYTRKGNRNWILTGKDGDKEVLLSTMAKTPIKRHVKIKGNANPYDPDWEAYFEKRRENQWLQKGKYRQRELWIRQKGLCTACRQKLELDDEMDIHHRKSIVNGGTDSWDNLMLLHTVCHQQIHYFHGQEASPGASKRLILA